VVLVTTAGEPTSPMTVALVVSFEKRVGKIENVASFE
jgi:hypothetical protein